MAAFCLWVSALNSIRQKGKCIWCFIFFTERCMYDLPVADTDLVSPFYFLWDCDMVSATCSSASSDKYAMRYNKTEGLWVTGPAQLTQRSVAWSNYGGNKGCVAKTEWEKVSRRERECKRSRPFAMCVFFFLKGRSQLLKVFSPHAHAHPHTHAEPAWCLKGRIL